MTRVFWRCFVSSRAAISLPTASSSLGVSKSMPLSSSRWRWAGRMPLIAPRRFNPEGEAWLAILHTQRGDRSYTALFSNTARAHQLGRTRDWVVIYQELRHDAGRTNTVVTGWRGALQGRRVVRGREVECAAYYRAD